MSRPYISKHFRGVRARLMLGAVALTIGALAAELVVTELPASATVTSSYYTIGTPTGSVTTVSATPLSVTTGADTAFEVSLVTPASLSGGSSSSVTVIPSESLGSAPVEVALAGGSCLQTGTAGVAGTGVDAADALTIDLESNCSIVAGSSIEVYFYADAPTSTGTFQFSVYTSANSGAATSNAISVGTSEISLSAAHYGFGDNTSYTISGITVGTNGAGSTLELASIVTTGSEAITFAAYAVDYQVLVTPSGGGTPSTDTVDTASSTGPAVTLSLASPVSVGETLTITAEGTNPAQSTASQADAIEVIVNGAAAVTTNSISFGNSVTDITVSPSSTIAGASAEYVVSFKVSTAGTGEIYMKETAGPTNFADVTAGEVVDNTQSWFNFESVTNLGTGMMGIPFGGTAAAGDVITVTLSNVINPPAGTVSDFAVYTSNDSVPAYAAPYTIGVNASPGVVVTVNPSGTGSLATYGISNLYASGALAAGSSTIALAGPSGTIFPAAPGDYDIVDTTSGVSGTAPSLSGGGGNSVTITVPDNVANGDKLTISIADVINPPTSSSTDSITLTGNVTGPAPTAPTTTTTTVPTTTTTTAPKPSASIRTTVLHVTNKLVHLRVYCTGAGCAGTISLTDVHTVVGSRKYAVAAGKSTLFPLTINSKGLSLLAHAKHKTIRVTEKVTVTGGKTLSRKISVIG